MQRQDRRKICRYYAKGRCVKQDCPFVHQQQTKKPCKFFTESGFCRKGKNCQFYHSTQQQLKKDKKFTQQNKHFKNYLHKKQQYNQNNNKQSNKQLNTNSNANINKIIKNQQQQQQQHNQSISFIDSLLNIQKQQQYKLTNENNNNNGNNVINEQQQLIKQLTQQLNKLNYQQQQQQQQLQYKQNNKLQFKMLYPHTFPDLSKTPQKKQYIKSIQQKYFSQKTFIKLISQLSQQKQPHKIQYFQIIRRYQDSFRLQQQHQPNIYIINLRPILFTKQINLHFKITQAQQRIIIKINQLQYPQIKARFQILNESIPIQYKHKLTQMLTKYHLKNNVFQTLKYLQNQFEKVYSTIKNKLENQYFTHLELKKKIQREKQKLQQYHHQIQQEKRKKQLQKQKKNHKQQESQSQKIILQNKQKQQLIHDNNNPNIHADNIKSQKQLKKQQEFNKVSQKMLKQYRDYLQLQFSPFDKPQHQNLNDQITIQSILLQNCPYIIVQKILLYIQCSCSKNIMYLFDANEKKQLQLCIKLKCKKCNNCMNIVWQREVVQLKSTLISRISITNGKIIDIGGIAWKIGCQCDQQILKNKLYLPGEKLNINCHSCFQNMTIMYNGIKFFNPFNKQFQIQQNKQLLIKGTCNHQKLSFKWTRYGCCGRPFACDQCHNLGSIKKHQILQGVTMICGFCSFQQSISSDCLRCKKELLKGIDKAGHWEGGMGCRDKNLLSKKDAKKYSGITKVNKDKK